MPAWQPHGRRPAQGKRCRISPMNGVYLKPPILSSVLSRAALVGVVCSAVAGLSRMRRRWVRRAARAPGRLYPGFGHPLPSSTGAKGVPSECCTAWRARRRTRRARSLARATLSSVTGGKSVLGAGSVTGVVSACVWSIPDPTMARCGARIGARGERLTRPQARALRARPLRPGPVGSGGRLRGPAAASTWGPWRLPDRRACRRWAWRGRGGGGGSRRSGGDKPG